MEYISITMTVVSILLMLLLWKERKKNRLLQGKYENLDWEYTRLLAGNMEKEEELERLNADYHKQQEMASEIKKLHEKTRLLKHDMKNHSMVIASYLNENKVEEAKTYISHIMDDLNKMYTYIHVGNALLSYIINNKFKEAANKGVAVKAEIRNLAFEGMESVDFSALLNNLLDNAIEGAGHSIEKKMVVNILEKKGFACVYVANTIKESVLKNNPEFETRKEGEGHGFGMKQILRITKKYQGMADIYEEDGYFCINIMFPNLF